MSDRSAPSAPPGGEPVAGTEPADDGRPDRDDDTVLSDPGDGGATTDVTDDGQSAVTPADPAVADEK